MKGNKQQVPEELEVIISEENIKLAIKKNNEEAENRKQEKERREIKQKEWRFFLKEAKSLFPKMLHRYIAKARTEEQMQQRCLLFHVPGLSPFWAELSWSREKEHYLLHSIVVTGLYPGDQQDEPQLLANWGKKYTLNDLSEALAFARHEYLRFEVHSIKRAEILLERRRAEKENRRQARESEKRIVQAEDQKRSEEQALFESLKSDPVVILLLKAFLLIREERNTFAEQIESADNFAESIERHMSEKLRLAKENADHAYREASDERRRKEDLQDELDKAEKKIKRGS